MNIVESEKKSSSFQPNRIKIGNSFLVEATTKADVFLCYYFDVDRNRWMYGCQKKSIDIHEAVKELMKENEEKVKPATPPPKTEFCDVCGIHHPIEI